MELIENNLKVEFENAGEGWGGDYNPSDPGDQELLRFYISEQEHGEWTDISDASYCTAVPADTPETDQAALLRMIMEAVLPLYENGESIKRTCEDLSHISPAWLMTSEPTTTKGHHG